MPVSEVDSVTAAELEALMREFPDWKEEFPDIYKDVYPKRSVICPLRDDVVYGLFMYSINK